MGARMQHPLGFNVDLGLVDFGLFCVLESLNIAAMHLGDVSQFFVVDTSVEMVSASACSRFSLQRETRSGA